MADPVYKSADAARAAAMAARPTAFAQMSSVKGTGNLNAPFIYSADDPFYQFAFATEATAKAQAAQRLNQALNRTPSSVSGFNNQFEYLQSLLRKSGLSKSAMTDSNVLSNVVVAAAAQNLDPFSFLKGYIAKIQPKVIKQPDTTTQYTKQIQTALQFKDLGDARQYYSDAYFATHGSYPTAELDKKFQNAWNNEVKSQDQPTTTTTKVEKAPIYDKNAIPLIDKATGKQQIDKFNNPIFVDKKGNKAIVKDKNGVYQYTDVITGTSTAKGEGFTTPEQQQFLADFLINNSPDATWNVANLGGAAKSLYDGITAFHKSNYTKVPDMTTLLPLMKNVLSSADENAANEFLTQYKNTVRKQTASKYMGLADYLNAGEDADKYVKPILEGISSLLERNFTIDDPFANQIFNYKDDKGVYRLPNALELNNMVMDHADYGKTAVAVNQAVDMTQNLKSKLGR
jgi:hypothetical protein